MEVRVVEAEGLALGHDVIPGRPKANYGAQLRT